MHRYSPSPAGPRKRNQNYCARSNSSRSRYQSPKTSASSWSTKETTTKAIEQFRRAIDIDPTEPQAVATRRALGWAYELRGMHEQALAEFIEASRTQNAGPERLSAFRRAFDEGGMKGYWRAWLQLQSDRIERGRISPASLAQVYAFLGETEPAFKALEQAFADHTIDVAALQFSPVFDALRTDARYKNLLRRLGRETQSN